MSGGFAPLVEPLGVTAEPAEICARFLDLPYLLFLDSAGARSGPGGPAEGQQLEQYSFLAADPARVVRSKGATTEIRTGPDGLWTSVPDDALKVARALLPQVPSEPVSGLPPFQGGIAGYIGYDWGAVLERLRAPDTMISPFRT